MGLPVWGSLQKSQVDDETIEEAIARLIQAHDDDANAHLDAGQSLKSHKASAIIDHLALSIVQDKIGDGEISMQKLLADYFFIMTCFESLDGWDVSGTTLQELGSMRLETTAILNSYNWTQAVPLSTVGLQWAKDFFWQSNLKLHAITDQLAWFGVGGLPPGDALSFAGFKVDDGDLYAYAGEDDGGGWDYQETQITGITLTNYNTYRMIYNQSAGELEFYVNGVLKVTFDTGLPTTDDDPYSMYYLKTTTTTKKYLTAHDLLFSRPK